MFLGGGLNYTERGAGPVWFWSCKENCGRARRCYYCSKSHKTWHTL